MLPSRDSEKDLPKTALNNMLLQAVKKGDDGYVASLIAAGADPDCRNENQRTLLYIATSLGHSRIVELLLQSGANPDARNAQGVSAIYLACQIGSCEIVSELITALQSRGVDLTLSYTFTTLSNTKECCHPVTYAIKKGHFDVVKLFIEKAGLPISFREPDYATHPGSSLLQYAVMYDAMSVLQYLLERQADPDITDTLGNTAVHTAAICNNAVMIKHLLIHAKAKYNAKNKEGKTPLEVAINYGHMDAAEELIHFLAKDTNTSNHLALIYLANGNQRNKTRLLTIHINDYFPATKNSPDNFAQIVNGLLYVAAGKGYEDVVGALLEVGADPNYIHTGKDKNSCTVIAHAAFYGHTAIVRKLVGAGSQIYFRNISALYAACQQGKPETVAALIEMGADLTQFIKTGFLVYQHPIHTAAQRGHHVVVEQLVKAGVNPNIKTSGVRSYGHTAAYFAITRSHTAVLRTLFQAGVGPEMKTSRGFTALYCAAYHDQEEAVKFLLENNASPTAKSSWGFTPLYAALTAEKHDEFGTANILIEAIAKITTAENLLDNLNHILYSIPENASNRLDLICHVIGTFIISLFSVTHIKAGDLIALYRNSGDSAFKLAKEVLYYVDSLTSDKNKLYDICNEALGNSKSLRAVLLNIPRVGTNCSPDRGTLAKYTALRKQLLNQYYEEIESQLDKRHVAQLSAIENMIAAAVKCNDDEAVMANLKSLREYNRLYPSQDVVARLRKFDAAHKSALVALYESLGDQLLAVAVPVVSTRLSATPSAITSSEPFSHSLFAPVRHEAEHGAVTQASVRQPAARQTTAILAPSSRLTADYFASHPYLNIATQTGPAISQIESPQIISPPASQLIPAATEQPTALPLPLTPLAPQPLVRSAQTLFTVANSPTTDAELVAMDNLFDDDESAKPVSSIPKSEPPKETALSNETTSPVQARRRVKLGIM